MSASSTRAESWHEGRAGRHRALHLATIVAGSAVYLSSETLLKSTLAADTCRLCSPNGLDRSVRDAVVWNDLARAVTLSNATGFVAAPALAISMVAFASSGGIDHILDDTIPVIEAGVIAGLFNQVAKFSVGRRRPFVEFGDPARPPELDDNTSFYSGHTTLAFALATSAGIVAHRRHTRLEPVIWASGYLLAATTGYLRMAGDRHYLTDVVVGAATGVAIGIAVPVVFHGRRIELVPARDGVALAGRF